MGAPKKRKEINPNCAAAKSAPALQGLTVTRPIFDKKSTGKRLNPRKVDRNANTNKQKSEKRIEKRGQKRHAAYHKPILFIIFNGHF